MAANYDNSAWFYDRLSRLVYGRALINAQVYLLQYIPQNSKILIAGGGTGWILEELTRLHPSGLVITYAEVSANMMALSKKRNTGNNQVKWINKPVEDINDKGLFDVVITPFLFDNFSDATMKKVFAHLHSLLKKNGQWLCADFAPTGKRWQSILLKSMLVFFRLLCRIEASALPDIDSEFEKYGYKVVEQKRFFGDFIVCICYLKMQ